MPGAPRSIALEWSPTLWSATIFFCVLPALTCVPAEVPRVLASGVWVVTPWILWLSCRVGWRLRGACLKPDEDGAVLEVAGRPRRGRVLADSLVLGYCVVLVWVPEAGGRAERFCLLRDGFDVEAWRQLKIWVRWTLRDA
ncbi:hypothetical protein [Viridibacterium curvum]|uniref:Toxin CptA n=1 Tax=Viridibacterium curvum TaxID=1101404 RepID=A0ABP9QW49_9RHOO